MQECRKRVVLKKFEKKLKKQFLDGIRNKKKQTELAIQENGRRK
jgi:hypothetical protein